MVRLFVYGTLRKGMGNHAFFNDYDIEIETAFVRGTLFANGLPYFKDRGNDLIRGDLVTFKNYDDVRCLSTIDKLEGHPRHYKRIKKKVKTLDNEEVDAWIYEYQHPIKHSYTVQDWVKYKKGYREGSK